MKVRSIDTLGDWLFGKGFNDYKTNANAVAQNLKTRLNSWLGDCFFDQGAGLNWQAFLGSKSQLQMNLAISAVIINTAGVDKVTQLSINLTTERRLTIQYEVLTVFGPTAGTTEVQI